jgi:hypothetical protein
VLEGVEKPELRLREINRLKNKINFGNIPNFYHSVSTSLGLAEGMYKYGFENSLDILLDKKNWNLELLGGRENGIGDIECEKMPRLSIYKLFTQYGYEIHCIPWLKDHEFERELRNVPEMEFKSWNPSLMKVVFRISQLHKFMLYSFEHGDEADLELIKYAHNITEDFIEDLQTKLNIQKVHGISVKGFYGYAEKKFKNGDPIYLPPVYRFD